MTDTPQDRFKDAPNPQLPVPSFLPFLLLALLLGWFVIASIITGGLTAFLPQTWPSLALTLLPTVGLTLLLGIPAAGLVGLAFWQPWPGLRPIAISLLGAAIYLTIEAAIRAVSEPGGSMETVLRLTLLTTVALLVGGGGLLWAGVPRYMLAHAFGFDRPPLAGLVGAIGLTALVTVGWPLTGALGDSWTAQFIVLQNLAYVLPEIIFFWGAVLGIITFNFQHKKVLAAIITLAIYLACLPGQLVPHQNWASLLLPLAALPLGLMLLELRALTGSIWAGLLFATFFWAAPPLFTDPRDELPLLTQPWQDLAGLWQWAAAGGLVVLLWAGRQFLAPRWSLGRWGTLGAALAFTLLLGGIWGGLWAAIGTPGFYNDGFLIIMTEQADLTGAAAIADLPARRAEVRDRLIATAAQTQPPVRQALEQAGLRYRSFYLINMLAVEGHHRQMADFAGLPGVARVMLNPNVRPYPVTFDLPYGGTPQEAQGIGPNIAQVQADKVWQAGLTGQGIVIAGQDTGYDWQHPALKNAYRGRDGDHAYNWHDAWGMAPEPFDDGQHGTHTMGTMLGDDGSGNQIGMAPGAQWMGCRNMRRGIGNPAGYTDCMEFLLAPYPPGGDPFTEGEVSRAPHVVNNSWGCPDVEGCDDVALEPAVRALRAAGIMMVVSAGNDGPACETLVEPPARYDDVFSVGATNGRGTITGFSSRGPVPGETTMVKPDIAAPGAAIRSSVPGGGYGLADGTSMAGPHVAGLVALLWSANPALIGQIEATEEIIRHSARPVPVNETCAINAAPSGEPSLLEQLESLNDPAACACGEASGVPNNVYGWGEIDALKAVELAQDYRAGN
jgi:hypothetical protein